MKGEKSRLQDTLEVQKAEYERKMKALNNSSKDVKVAEDKLDKVCVKCSFTVRDLVSL